MEKFPVRFVSDQPKVTVKGVDGEREFTYEGNWKVDLYSPDVTCVHNYETMFHVEKDTSGLQVLLKTGAVDKKSTPPIEIPIKPLKVQREITASAGKKKQLSPATTIQTSSRTEEVKVAKATKPPQVKEDTSGKAEKSRSPPSVSDSPQGEGLNSVDGARLQATRSSVAPPVKVKQLLGNHKEWLTAVRENVHESLTWDNLCQKAQIQDKAKVDLESDILDWVSNMETKRDVHLLSRSALDLYFALDPEIVRKNYTPLHTRKGGKLPTQFQVEF
jgi:hypothetical protein